MPMEVVVRSPMTERKRIPMAKVRLRLENGTRMTIIDWEITQGLMLLPLEVALLGLFIRATTCADRLALRMFFNSTRSSFSDDAPLHLPKSPECPKLPRFAYNTYFDLQSGLNNGIALTTATLMLLK